MNMLLAYKIFVLQFVYFHRCVNFSMSFSRQGTNQMIILEQVEQTEKDRWLLQTNRPITEAYQMKNKAQQRRVHILWVIVYTTTIYPDRYRDHGRHRVPLADCSLIQTYRGHCY